MNKHPNAVINPPMTAVTLVDFRRQNAIVTGEMSNATPVDIAPNHPETLIISIYFVRVQMPNVKKSHIYRE